MTPWLALLHHAGVTPRQAAQMSVAFTLILCLAFALMAAAGVIFGA